MHCVNKLAKSSDHMKHALKRATTWYAQEKINLLVDYRVMILQKEGGKSLMASAPTPQPFRKMVILVVKAASCELQRYFGSSGRWLNWYEITKEDKRKKLTK